jgi:molecular chaperone GrpE (heat shock protein)
MAETRLLLAEASPTTASTETPQFSHPERASNTTASNAVEARIKELHAELKLTQAQEELWSKVTQVMRDNEKAMEALHKTRSERMKTMTAVQDVKSYAEIAEAHADGLKKFVPVFEALYNSMSDEQKKNADTLFSRDPMAEKNTPAKRRGKP